MDAIEKAVAVLRKQIKDLEDGIAVLLRISGTVQSRTHNVAGSWTTAQRRAAARRAKAQWRKRKALKAQNRAKVTRVAAKKNG